MPHDRPVTRFQMGCFVVAEFLLTCESRGPSAIAEHLVIIIAACASMSTTTTDNDDDDDDNDNA